MKALHALALLLAIAACKNNSNATEQSKTSSAQGVNAPAKTTPPAPTVDGAIAITVDAEGYHPSTVKAPAGKKATLVFTRTTDKSCGTEVVFPTLNIKKDLPLNQPIAVEIDMPASGSLAFACGMDMLKGAIVAL